MHSALCIVHCALCIAPLAVFAATATAEVGGNAIRFGAFATAEVVALPAEQRVRDFVLEFDARFAAGAPRDLVLRLGFSWGDTQVHVNERHPVGGNAIRISAFGVY